MVSTMPAGRCKVQNNKDSLGACQDSEDINTYTRFRPFATLLLFSFLEQLRSEAWLLWRVQNVGVAHRLTLSLRFKFRYVLLMNRNYCETGTYFANFVPKAMFTMLGVTYIRSYFYVLFGYIIWQHGTKNVICIGNLKSYKN